MKRSLPDNGLRISLPRVFAQGHSAFLWGMVTPAARTHGAIRHSSVELLPVRPSAVPFGISRPAHSDDALNPPARREILLFRTASRICMRSLGLDPGQLGMGGSLAASQTRISADCQPRDSHGAGLGGGSSGLDATAPGNCASTAPASEMVSRASRQLLGF